MHLITMNLLSFPVEFFVTHRSMTRILVEFYRYRTFIKPIVYAMSQLRSIGFPLQEVALHLHKCFFSL